MTIDFWIKILGGLFIGLILFCYFIDIHYAAKNDVVYTKRDVKKPRLDKKVKECKIRVDGRKFDEFTETPKIKIQKTDDLDDLCVICSQQQITALSISKKNRASFLLFL